MGGLQLLLLRQDHEALGRPDQVWCSLEKKLKGTNRRWWKQDLASVSTLVSFVQSSWLFSYGFPWSYSWEAELSKYNCPRAPGYKPKAILLPYFHNCHCFLNETQGLLKPLHSQAGSDRASFLKRAAGELGNAHSQPWGHGQWGPDPTLITQWTFIEPFTSAKPWPLAHVHASPHFHHSKFQEVFFCFLKRITTPVPFYRWKNRGPERLVTVWCWCCLQG